MQATAVKDAVDSKDEPSMEEILASIRKIISEQDAPPAEAQRSVIQEDLVVPKKQEQEKQEEDEEPFDLTQVLEDDGTITDIAVLRAPPVTFEEILATETDDSPSARGSLASQEIPQNIEASVDILMETTDVFPEDVIQEEEAFFVESPKNIEENSVEDAEIDAVAVEAIVAESAFEENGTAFAAHTITTAETQEEEAYLPPHLDIHEQLENIAAEMNKEDEEFTMEHVFEEESSAPLPLAEGLLSTAAAQASLAALANLKRTLAQPAPVKVSTEEGRTVEDLLSDLLKPMLKEWLDTNLPPMIENIVTAEIKKLTSAL